MTQSADSHYFSEQALKDWTAIAAKHGIRDEYFLRRIETYLRPGPVLEIGAATGQLSAILKRHGYDVTASDVSPRFVAAIAARGVPAEFVDASRDILSQTGRSFSNILAQNVIPLIRRDPETVNATLTAIYGALQPGGRFISIAAHSFRCSKPQAFYRPREQFEMAERSGLFRMVRTIPHQVIPTALYRRWNAPVLNFLDFELARIASVRLVLIAEKLG
jgi:SAM-dependent methyltransferase